jgi:hypothetical protein
MSRLANAHAPKNIYSFLEFFESKLQHRSLDVVLLYTDGLYMNSNEIALNKRQKSIAQIIQHKNDILSLIDKGKKYIPKAFHFLPWDYLVLNAENFVEMRTSLNYLCKHNRDFQRCVLADLENNQREATAANISFILEELAISHLIQQKLVPFPHTLASEAGWRLICYPGKPICSLVFLHQNNSLPKNKRIKENALYSHSLYDMEKCVLIDFENFDFDQIGISNQNLVDNFIADYPVTLDGR